MPSEKSTIRKCERCGKTYDSYRAGARFCSYSCSNRALPRRKTPVAIEVRFWRNVNKDGPIPSHAPELGKCWLWGKGSKSSTYPRTSTGTIVEGNRQETLVHRISWEIHFGPIPQGFECLHKCDNTQCVRPTHLFLGTQSDNMRDGFLKERVKLPEQKLSADQVQEIRKLHKQGQSCRNLAKIFPVDETSISKIVNGHTWKHLL